MSTKSKAVVVAGLVLVGSALAYAQRPDMGGPEGGPGGGGQGGPQGGEAMGMSPGGMGPHGGRTMGGGPGCKINPDHLKGLGATDEQIKAVEAVQDESEKEAVTLKANLELAQLKMRQQMKSELVDRKAVLEAVNAMIAAQGEMMKAGILAQLKVREILGAELAKKLHGSGQGMKSGVKHRSQERGIKGAGQERVHSRDQDDDRE